MVEFGFEGERPNLAGPANFSGNLTDSSPD